MHFSGWQQNGYSGFGWYVAPQAGQALSASTTRPSQGQHVHEMREVIDVTFGERSFGRMCWSWACSSRLTHIRLREWRSGSLIAQEDERWAHLALPRSPFSDQAGRRPGDGDGLWRCVPAIREGRVRLRVERLIAHRVQHLGGGVAVRCGVDLAKDRRLVDGGLRVPLDPALRACEGVGLEVRERRDAAQAAQVGDGHVALRAQPLELLLLP